MPTPATSSLVPREAEWGKLYSDSAVPRVIPFGSKWIPATFVGTDFQQDTLAELQLSELPPITPETVTGILGRGVLPQMAEAVAAAKPTFPQLDETTFYPAFWEWHYNGPFAAGSKTPAWTLRMSQVGTAIRNFLNPNEGIGITKAVNIILPIIFAIVGQGIAGAVGGAAGGAAGSTTSDSGAPPEQLSGPPPDTNSVGSTVGGALAGAGSAAGNASGAVDGGIGSTVGDAGQVAGDLTGSISDNIGSLLDDVKGFVGDVLGPIADTIHSLSSEVQDINENLIKPITGPITSILNNYKALSTELQSDLHSGITGLLRVPQDISNALSSVDATMQRSITQLGAVNQAVVHQELGPGVGAGVSQGVDHMAAALNVGLDKFNGSEFDPQIKHIHDDATIADIAAAEEKIASWINSQSGLLGKILAGALDGVLSLTLVIDYLESKRALYHQIGAQKFPSALLDAATALAALRRGILDDPTVQTELGKQGFNADRIAVLKELDRELPSESDALNWRARGIIDDQALGEILSARGWRDDDQVRMRNGHTLYPDPQTVLRWLKRGFIERDEAYQILQTFDYRLADQIRLEQDSWLTPQVGDVLGNYDRRAVVDAQLAPQSVGGAPPADVLAQLATIGIDANLARLLWSNHFTLLSPELGVQAYFRGFINLPQLQALLQAGGVAPEQWQNYIDLQRPQLTVRLIPSLLKAGIIDRGRGLDYLRQLGFADPEANLLLTLAGQKPSSPGTANGTALHGLTSGAILQLYDSGALDPDEALKLLGELGVGEEAAPLMLELSDLHRGIAERKAAADLIVAQARAGLISFDQAQSELHAAQLTTTEVGRALAQLERDLVARVKLPSDAQVVAMYKHGVIDRGTAADTLALLGYSATWAERIIQLEEAGKNAGTGKTAAPGAAPGAGG